MKKVTSQDIKRINEVFQDSGIVYTEKDDMFVSESNFEVLNYIFENDSEHVIEIMNKVKQYKYEESLLEEVLQNVGYVYCDYENGKYYVIVQ